MRFETEVFGDILEERSSQLMLSDHEPPTRGPDVVGLLTQLLQRVGLVLDGFKFLTYYTLKLVQLTMPWLVAVEVKFLLVKNLHNT